MKEKLTREAQLTANEDSREAKPVQDSAREQQFRKSAEKITKKHAGLFRRLSK